jgi:glycosyltransferase involved in cell wall biosynthesis
LADELELTILMPCLNEAETLRTCIDKAQGYLARSGVSGEVLIADNGSTDGSQAIATGAGARVIEVATKGYGAALAAGIAAARSRFVIMGDADDSYDFANLDRFVEALRAGNLLVMGNRFKGGIAPGAMPWHHKYIGNPVLSFIGRLFFGTRASDFHCGLRGFDRAAILALNLRTTGMEFASEMVVKASLQDLRIAEVPTTLQPDGRSRAPHLRTWRDGWRHLRFLLMYSPRWLFFYPGVVLSILGLLLTVWLLPGERHLGRLSFDVDSLTYAIGLLLIGVHITVFAVSAKVFGTREGLLPANPTLEHFLDEVSLENGLLFGVFLLLIGFGVFGYALNEWHAAGFGHLTATRMLRFTLPSAAALMLGVEAIFASFFLGLLQIHRR